MKNFGFLVLVALMLSGVVGKAQVVKTWEVQIVNDLSNTGIASAKSSSGQIELRTKTWLSTNKGVNWIITKYTDGNYTIHQEFTQGPGYLTCTYNATASGSPVWLFPGGTEESRKAVNRQWKIVKEARNYTIRNAVSGAVLTGDKDKMQVVGFTNTRNTLWYFVDGNGNQVY